LITWKQRVTGIENRRWRVIITHKGILEMKKHMKGLRSRLSISLLSISSMSGHVQFSYQQGSPDSSQTIVFNNPEQTELRETHP
jgi:hypothetical protein